MIQQVSVSCSLWSDSSCLTTTAKQTNKKNSHCLIHVLPTTLLTSPPSFIHDYMKIMKWKKMHHAGEAAPGCPHSHHMPLDSGSSLWSGSVQPPQAGPH